VPDQEQEQSLSISQYVQMVRHRKWWLISGLFIGWAIVTAVSWVLPAKYRSEAVVLVERQQVNETLVKPNVQTSLQQRLDAMTQRVLSRSRLKSLIDKDKLYPKQVKSTGIDDVIDLMRKDIEIELVVANKKKADDLTGFKVSYGGSSAKVAQQVTGELVQFFLDENDAISQENSKQATDFFKSELENAKKDLDDQELKLREFKARHLGVLPEQLASNLQILNGLQGRLQAANDGLSRAQQQQTYLQSLLSQYHTNTDTGEAEGSAPPMIEQHLTEMKAQLAALRARYTDKHPDVVRLEQDIAQTESLQKSMEADVKSGKSSGQREGLAPLAQVKSQLKANELDIAGRRKDIKDIESEISVYQARLNQTPQTEQELAGVIRDHAQSQSNYDSLLARMQQSELASNLVTRQQGEQFRVVDPPSLPATPEFPDHLKFSLGGIGAGLALGLILTVGREITNQFVYTDQQALSLVRAPILTSVPSLATESEKSKQKRSAIIQTVAASLLLIMIPLGTLFAYLHG